ncbi:MAG: hypothetical protein GF383_03350 [Candidatus Lokiarchaeota archaeon]|nr:hypothetical protein [Candidatus Lokiarchaeota archaeon]MBD3338670.1 hypothetical protein [Candidatus Lokiarchaeota archaeon]
MTEIVQKHEVLIYELVQEYVEQNRVFNAKQIVPYLTSRITKSKINLNEKGIKLILQKLIEKDYIREGTTLIKSELLKNQNREKIYTFIKNHPGTFFQRIVKELRYNKSVVAWHLKILQKFNCIDSLNFDNRDIYVVNDFPVVIAKIVYLCSHKKSYTIIKYFLKNHSNVKKSDLYKRLNMHHYTVKKFLSLLEETQIIKREIKSRTSYYEFNKEYFQSIIRKYNLSV